MADTVHHLIGKIQFNLKKLRLLSLVYRRTVINVLRDPSCMMQLRYVRRECLKTQKEAQCGRFTSDSSKNSL